MKKRKFSIEYRWAIIAASFLMVFVSLGFCSSNKSLYLSAITETLGIKRSLFSLNDSCRYIMTAVMNVFFGAAVSKFGTKRMIGFGFASLIASMLIYAYASSIAWFCVGGCFLGIGLAFTTTTMVGSVVNQWCRDKKGRIMGAVLAANGLGGALAAQIISPIIYEEGNSFGYRNAYKLVALILFVSAAVILLVFKERGASQANEKSERAIRQSWEGFEYKESVKKPYFVATMVCVFMTGLVLQGINGMAAAHMKDVGLDAAFIAIVLSVHSIALAAFKFLTGLVYDKKGLRFTMTVCDIAAVLMTFLLANIAATQFGSALAMLYGILSALALPLETIMLPLLTGRLFGNKSYDRLLGLVVAVNTAGYAIGNPVVNWCYDRYGTYAPMLYIFCGIMAAVTITFQFIVSASARDRGSIQ